MARAPEVLMTVAPLVPVMMMVASAEAVAQMLGQRPGALGKIRRPGRRHDDGDSGHGKRDRKEFGDKAGTNRSVGFHRC